MRKRWHVIAQPQSWMSTEARDQLTLVAMRRNPMEACWTKRGANNVARFYNRSHIGTFYNYVVVRVP